MSTRKVLIVDGERAVATELEHELTSLGYSVAGIATSAEEARSMVAAAAADVVLMRFVPGTGIESAPREALPTVARCAVILISTEPDAAALREAGFREPDDYIVRPFSARELRAVIELALFKSDAENAVREVEDRFFEDSIDLLCHLDFNGRFKRLNPAWERTLGFTREELMSRPFIEFVHPDDRDRTLKQNAAVRAGERALGFENRYVCKDGSYRWFHWNATPNSSGRVIYSVARDITDSKRSEVERELMVRELKEALAEMKSMRAILPICSSCKRIRDDEDYWHSIEHYVAMHTPTMFSHGICPSCMKAREDSDEHLEREREL